ncbi:hypothetical protein Clacol_002537 [Clathrus columnatus]|uniref:Multidrug and toxin extrusion protein n=1 Tax=Clathrus columnatus TaxID=1419009 RepID=A0AAV5A104_9AGAM|nr:hypothetical protein Clacol_002537 [Clathrus columnatus]
MSSTYLHYSSSPSSLPFDYGLVARYRQHNQIHDIPSHDHENDPGLNEDASFQAHDILNRRRNSFAYGTIPHKFSHPIIQTTKYPSSETLSEAEPLLGRIPRIPEETPDTPASEVAIWRNEAGIFISVYGAKIKISIGHISTTALAAATMGSMTASVTGYSIIQGFVSCLDTLLPGAWTGPHPQLVGLWSQRMGPIAFIWFNAEAILLLLGQEPEIARLAGIYLKISTIALPAYGFNNITRRYFQSQGLFTVPTRIVMITAPINALLNYLLVWGPEPIRFGFIGAPLASVLSFNLMALLNALYGLYWIPRTAWHPFTSRSFKELGVIVQLGLAGVGQTASEWWSWELIALAASFLGSTVLAAQSILLTSASTSYQAPFALSVATAVRVGNLLGEENGKRAAIAARVSLLLTCVIAAVMSATFVIFRKKWGLLFNEDKEVIALVSSILPLVALFQLFDGLAGTTGGILRARGRQFTGAMLNLSAYYVIGIPLALYLTFKLGMGLIGLWLGLTVALVYCAVLGVWIALRTDWNLEVQKVKDRAERERQLGKRMAEEIQRR